MTSIQDKIIKPKLGLLELAKQLGGVEQKAHFFAFYLPHSDACYVRAYPAATAEAWMDGHVHAFGFFGRVPQPVLYDNDRCLVAQIQPDGSRKRQASICGADTCRGPVWRCADRKHITSSGFDARSVMTSVYLACPMRVSDTVTL